MFNYQQQQQPPHGGESGRPEIFMAQATQQRQASNGGGYLHHHQQQQWCQPGSPPAGQSSRPMAAAKPTVISAKATAREWAAAAKTNSEASDPFNPKDPESPTLSFSNQIEQLLRYKCNSSASVAAVDFGGGGGHNQGDEWWMQQQQPNGHPSAPPGLGHKAPAVIRNVPVMRSHQAAANVPRNSNGTTPSTTTTNYNLSPGSLRRSSFRRDAVGSSTTILMPASDLTTNSNNPTTFNPHQNLLLHHHHQQQHQKPSTTRRGLTHFQAVEHHPNWLSHQQPSSRHLIPSQSPFAGRLLVTGGPSNSGHSSHSPFMLSSNGSSNPPPPPPPHHHHHHAPPPPQTINYNTSNDHHQYWLGSPHYFYQQRRSSLSQSTEDLLDPFNGKKKKTVVEQIADRVMKRLLRLVCEEVDESRSKRDASVSTHDLMSTSDFYKNLFNAWKRSWISATDAVDFSAAAFASLCSVESPSEG